MYLSSSTFYTILFSGLFFRIYLAQLGTFQADMDYFMLWAGSLHEVGFDNFYNETWCDYMPLYLYVLYIVQHVGLVVPADYHVILFKLPSILADFSISILIFYFIKNTYNAKIAIIASLIYFYNPASISNSTLWGQADAFHLLPIFAAVILLSYNKFLAANLLLLLSVLIKPQSMVLAPLFIIFYLLSIYEDNIKNVHKKIIKYIFSNIAIVVSAVFVVSYPFIKTELADIPYHRYLIESVMFIKSRFVFGYDTYPYTSANAFNFWAVVDGLWKSDQRLLLNLTLQNWGTAIFAAIYICILILYVASNIRNHRKLKRINNNTVFPTLLIFFTMFMFVTRVHERHFLPVVLFSVLLIPQSRQYFYSYAIVSVFYCLNMLYAYFYDVSDLYISSRDFDPYVPLISLCCLAVFIFYIIKYLQLLKSMETDDKRYTKE